MIDILFLMNKNYNYLRRRLIIPEYGRHIQEMVDSLLEIEDRDERTRQAKAVIAVMGNINPLLHDSTEFAHKLWDHLFIMSDFRLDVDSPYPQPMRENLQVKPDRLEYPQSYISHKHYGKNIIRMLGRIANSDASKTGDEMGNILRYMRNKSVEYNQELPTGEMLANDVSILTEGAISLDENCLQKIEMENKTASSRQKSAKRQPQRGRQTQKSGRKNTQRHNTQK